MEILLKIVILNIKIHGVFECWAQLGTVFFWKKTNAFSQSKFIGPALAMSAVFCTSCRKYLQTGAAALQLLPFLVAHAQFHFQPFYSHKKIFTLLCLLLSRFRQLFTMCSPSNCSSHGSAKGCRELPDVPCSIASNDCSQVQASFCLLARHVHALLDQINEYVQCTDDTRSDPQVESPTWKYHEQKMKTISGIRACIKILNGT